MSWPKTKGVGGILGLTVGFILLGYVLHLMINGSDFISSNANLESEIGDKTSEGVMVGVAVTNQPRDGGAKTTSDDGPVQSNGSLGVLPMPPVDFIPNKLVADPILRKNLLETIRQQKNAGMASFHKQWLDGLQLTQGQSQLLLRRIVDYEVGIAALMLPESKDGGFPRPPAVEDIAASRAQHIEALRTEFGEKVSESYSVQFPGPTQGGPGLPPTTLQSPPIEPNHR